MTRGFSLARLRRDLSSPAGASTREIFLVGGIVRDGLDGRRGNRDIDLAVDGGEEEVARRLSARGWGKAFRIAGARQGIFVWRVAGPKGSVDVARFGGSGGLAGDLARRDFTINAMARDLRSGRLFDPFGGRRDLRARLIRAVSAKNFDEDPVRLLRAYRFAAQIGARIAPATRALIRARVGSLPGVAAERVRDELALLLGASGREAALAIAASDRDGVLASALGLGPGPPLTAAAVRRTEGKDALTDRLTLLFRRANVDSANAKRRLAAVRFGASAAARVGSRLRLLEVTLDRPFDGRPLHRAFTEASMPSRALLSAAAATPLERRRTRRADAWLGRANLSALPFDGNEISDLLSLPPGPMLGKALAEARYRFFAGDWKGRRAIRDGLLEWIRSNASIDRPPGLG